MAKSGLEEIKGQHGQLSESLSQDLNVLKAMGVGEMVQSVKHLLHKLEDFDWSPEPM